MNSINSINKGRMSTSIFVTESSCDDTKSLKKIREAILCKCKYHRTNTMVGKYFFCGKCETNIVIILDLKFWVFKT